MVLSDELLEVVEIPMVLRAVASSRDKESEQEENDDEGDEEEGVLDRRPEAAGQRATLFLDLDLIIFFMPEIGKGDDNQAQQSIEAIQAIVDDLECEEDAVDAFGGSPVFLGAESRRASRGDESDIDGEEQDGSEQRCQANDGDDANDGGSFSRSLPREGGDEGGDEAEGDGDGVGDPDKTGLHEASVGHDEGIVGVFQAAKANEDQRTKSAEEMKPLKMSFAACGLFCWRCYCLGRSEDPKNKRSKSKRPIVTSLRTNSSELEIHKFCVARVVAL